MASVCNSLRNWTKLSRLRAILAASFRASSAAMCVADLERDREVGADILGAEGFAIDPAFQRYAFADKDGRVSIRRLSDDQELLPLPGSGSVSYYGGLEFSPDGRFLHQRCSVAKGFRSRLWDLDGPKPRAVLDDDNSGFTFRRDSRQCAASYQDGTIRILETVSGHESRRFRVEVDPTSCLGSPTGDHGEHPFRGLSPTQPTDGALADTQRSLPPRPVSLLYDPSIPWHSICAKRPIL
jgi:WD40 repeat protein